MALCSTLVSPEVGRDVSVERDEKQPRFVVVRIERHCLFRRVVEEAVLGGLIITIEENLTPVVAQFANQFGLGSGSNRPRMFNPANSPAASTKFKSSMWLRRSLSSSLSVNMLSSAASAGTMFEPGYTPQ